MPTEGCPSTSGDGQIFPPGLVIGMIDAGSCEDTYKDICNDVMLKLADSPLDQVEPGSVVLILDRGMS